LALRTGKFPLMNGLRKLCVLVLSTPKDVWTRRKGQACEGGGLNWINYLDTPALYDAVNAMTARQKRILTMLAMQELTTREIAARIGVSQSVVRDSIKAIKRKFEKFLKAHTQNP